MGLVRVVVESVGWEDVSPRRCRNLEEMGTTKR